MELMIDTNVIFDVLMERTPYFDASYQILQLCEWTLFHGHVSTVAIADLIYCCRKQLSPEATLNVCLGFSEILTIEDLKAEDLFDAALLKWKDFEDSVQYMIAKRIKADFIISRDLKGFHQSDIQVMTPQDFVENVLPQHVS